MSAKFRLYDFLFIGIIDCQTSESFEWELFDEMIGDQRQREM